MSDHVHFTVEVSMTERWVPQFLGMLRTRQRLGSIGATRVVGIYADGDGDFNPRFEWDIDVEPVDGQEREIRARDGYLYDAG